MKKFFSGLCATLLLSSALMIPLGKAASLSTINENTAFSPLEAFHVHIDDD